MKKSYLQFIFGIIASSITTVQAADLGLYNCNAIETYTQQEYPPVVVQWSGLNTQICAESQIQAEGAFNYYFTQKWSTPYWKVTGQCQLGGVVPFPLCQNQGQQL